MYFSASPIYKYFPANQAIIALFSIKGTIVSCAWIQRENNRKRTEKEKDFITFSLHIDKGCYKLCCYLYQKFFQPVFILALSAMIIILCCEMILYCYYDRLILR